VAIPKLGDESSRAFARARPETVRALRRSRSDLDRLRPGLKSAHGLPNRRQVCASERRAVQQLDGVIARLLDPFEHGQRGSISRVPPGAPSGRNQSVSHRLAEQAGLAVALRQFTKLLQCRARSTNEIHVAHTNGLGGTPIAIEPLEPLSQPIEASPAPGRRFRRALAGRQQLHGDGIAGRGRDTAGSSCGEVSRGRKPESSLIWCHSGC
jgi:hypothetical protein